MRSSVAVVGLGNIGAALTGCLQSANRHDVIVCARRPVDRLTLDRRGGVEQMALRCVTDPGELQPVEWVMLCCKAQDTQTTAAWLARLCTPASRVVVLQNGIDHVDRVAPYVGSAKIL